LVEFHKKVANLKEKIEKHIFHPYLRQFINPPSIDEDKLIILISIMEELDLSPLEKDALVQAVMFMNVALDTHDDVSNALLDKDGLQIRQLTVLAGDYYSGLYYKYLSGIGDIQLIKRLSEGVKNINEHKVSIYHKDQDDFESIMNSTKVVEFSLIEKLTSHFGITYWDDITSNFLLIKRLIREVMEYKQTKSSVVFNAMKRLAVNNQSTSCSNIKEQELILICERHLEKAKKLVINGINTIPQKNHLLEKRIIEMMQSYFPMEKSFVEGG
jgi:heptaprenyl diphosphate synthase